MPITSVKIPVEFYKLKLSSAIELSIYALASSFEDKGLYASNGELARIFCVQRVNIVRTVKRLKNRGFIVIERENGYRKIIANSIKVILPDSSAGDTTDSINQVAQVVSNDAQSSIKEIPIILSNLKEDNLNKKSEGACASSFVFSNER